MGNGFSIILGAPPDDEAEEDTDRAAAKQALKRFRSPKNDDEALEAFMALCRYAKGMHGGGDMGEKMAADDEEY